jgi:hypothetical protein
MVVAFSLSDSHPAPGSVIHRSQGIEIPYTSDGINDTTVTVANLQVHDDDLNVDLGVAGRAAVDSHSDSGDTEGVLTIYPAGGALWGRGHTIRITVTDRVKDSSGSPIGPLVFTYTVEDRGPALLLDPRAETLMLSRWDSSTEPWKQHTADTLAEYDADFLLPTSVPWEGSPDSQAEIASMYQGYYNALSGTQRRGAWADSEYARIEALRYKAEGDATRGANAKAMILSWVDKLVPAALTDTSESKWAGQSLYYSILTIKWLHAYRLCYDLFTATEKASFTLWIKQHVDTIMEGQNRDGSDANPRFTRAWVNAACMVVAHFLGDHLLEDWVLTGASYKTVRNDTYTNPFPYYTHYGNAVVDSDSRDTSYPRLWDWRDGSIVDLYEVINPLEHLYAMTHVAHAMWVEYGDRSVWEYAHPTLGFTLKDLVAEYQKFIRQESGYTYITGYLAEHRSWSAQALSLAQFAFPSEALHGIILPSARGDHPYDVDRVFAHRGPAFLHSYPQHGYTQALDPVTPALLTEAETAKSWVRIEWSEPAAKSPHDFVAWTVSLNDVDQGTTTEPRFCLTGLSPNTRYRVRITAENESGETSEAGPLWVTTEDF